jgi:hypothetical protein
MKFLYWVAEILVLLGFTAIAIGIMAYFLTVYELIAGNEEIEGWMSLLMRALTVILMGVSVIKIFALAFDIGESIDLARLMLH